MGVVAAIVGIGEDAAEVDTYPGLEVQQDGFQGMALVGIARKGFYEGRNWLPLRRFKGMAPLTPAVAGVGLSSANSQDL